MWFETEVQLHYFECGHTVVLAVSVERMISFFLHCLGTLVKNQLTIVYGVFLDYQFYSTSLSLMPVSPSLDYCSFAVNFEIRKCESFNFVPVFQDCFGYSGSLAFSYEF